VKQTKVQKSARGQECTLRISGYGRCAPTETTVLTHAPCRDKGTGFKSPDWWGAFGCFDCHQLIDMRAKLHDLNFGTQRFLTTAEINEAWLRGIYETNKILREFGLIK
jgi:hypothetical protein